VANAKNKKSKSKKFDAVEWHRELITAGRYKGISSITGRSIDEEAASDRARVVYCSAFRRLQQRTQVFTVSKDAAVRTRLTHSLEVASVGRWVAQKVVDNKKLRKLGPQHCSALVSLVETGCLAHDIGNPPFGHFGEAAIQAWFRDNWKDTAGQLAKNKKLQVLVEDFLQFDGNPQGTRILRRLQGLTKNDRNQYGMDLTFSQVLTALKYPRGPKDHANRWGKAGFFESERPKIEKAWDALNFQIQQRFPLAYLVEAADDISYCISDMEDGIDQGVFTVSDFFSGIQIWIDNKNPKNPALSELRDGGRSRSVDAKKDPPGAKDHFMRFKAVFTRTMIDEAARAYGDGSSKDILDGSRHGLLDGTDADDLLKTLKGIARRFLYFDDRVQRPFLAGLRIVHGILDQYGEFLKLKRDSFAKLRKAWKSDDRGEVYKEKLQTLLPLLDRLPAHYLDVYDSTANEKASQKKWGEGAWEWFCRAHLIVDYLSGMTDDFAYRSYQVISGAKLE
jgi:dGTPase